MKELRGLHRALVERIIRPVAHQACIWHGSHWYGRVGVLLQALDLAVEAPRQHGRGRERERVRQENGWPAPVTSGQLVW
jgi:hypothetical protein